MRFAVKFLGCKVSQADVMLARRALLAAGHEEVSQEEAELHVVNTCCITREAEAKSRQAVRRSLQSARRVFVGGCAVNRDARQFAEIDPAIAPFVGTAEEVAQAMAGTLGGCADLEHDVLGRELARAAEEPAGLWAGGRTRGFVKVQDGCDCHCAYCIIPTVRGGARSRPAEAVLQEVRRRVENGQPEIVLTGISVGDYRDGESGLDLGELLMAAARVAGVERVRLSSVEVIHVKDSLVRALREEEKVCPHLHVPMQSGDDEVLAAMGRHYSAAEYLQAIEELRAGVPEVNLTTDVIVGFPNEDEAAFERTVELVERCQISKVHTFPYSARPGTVAAALGEGVTAQEKKRRSRALRGFSELCSRRHRTTKLASSERVLVDKVADTQCSGYTADYTRCYLPADAARAGELIEVEVRELYADGLRVSPVAGSR
ncbi:MAG TPA: tRNA (N(6)-L-threonylcarbamoyladenosine(37)-C(2))-methylthiotransferase MtaB [Solirubrobacteraceae bacterium]|nr:tRNA (N(6)-L-threonylcarbamoyladenosine(37)-C(2))-methylthiotransferase MtaB [Solirubrobacteraceae bacterium]